MNILSNVIKKVSRQCPITQLRRGGGDNIINAMICLPKILSSKVYDIAKETPLQLAMKLSERWGVNGLKDIISVYDARFSIKTLRRII